MKKLPPILIIIFIILLSTHYKAQTLFKNIEKDFSNLSGKWNGSLTYLDYATGKPFTMPADLEIKSITKTKHFIFSNFYPKESSANSSDTITISAGGKYINQEFVLSRKKLSNKNIEIITTESDKDGNDNKAAIFRHTYTLGKTIFKNKKEVQFNGENNWVMRHEYVYTKVPVKKLYRK